MLLSRLDMELKMVSHIGSLRTHAFFVCVFMHPFLSFGLPTVLNMVIDFHAKTLMNVYPRINYAFVCRETIFYEEAGRSFLSSTYSQYLGCHHSAGHVGGTE